MTCRKCAEKRHVELFNEFGRELVKREKNKLKVNWRVYIRNYLKNWPFTEDTILRSLGILSSKAEENWEIVSGALSLNPSHIYFTRKEDIIDFARLKYSNTVYEWQIRHIDEVIGKREVLGNIESK